MALLDPDSVLCRVSRVDRGLTRGRECRESVTEMRSCGRVDCKSCVRKKAP